MGTEQETIKVIEKHLDPRGRMISDSKYKYQKKHPDNIVCFNGNIFGDGLGKLWWGDIDLTLDANKIKMAAKEIGVTLYVLKEMEGRFNNEARSDYKKVSVWNSKMR